MAVNVTKHITEHNIVNAISIAISTFSLLFTTGALLICFTQQCWKKRDGVLLLNIFVTDLVFSCILIPLNVCFFKYPAILTENRIGVVLWNLFAFVFLLSWASQCLIAINRYVVIIFPFTYKEILSRNRLTCFVYAMWGVMFIGCTVACVLTRQPSHLNKNIWCYDQLIFTQLSKITILVLLAIHVGVLIVLLAMECYLWKVARGHQSRYRSITNSVSYKEELSTMPSSVETQQQRKINTTRNFQKRLSFSTQKITAKRTPFLLLGVHFATIIPYVTLGFVYIVGNNNEIILNSKFYVYTCMFLLIANSLRPIVNVFNNLPAYKIRRFKLFLQKLINKESAELCTEYYIENQKEVQTLFKLRRESGHSLMTEGSVV